MKIPNPYPGLVVNYDYLWHSEQQSGLENGAKSRPCIVLLSEDEIVTVVPITHLQPKNDSEYIEVTDANKTLLGLDVKRSFVICNDANQFKWPGPDLRLIHKKKSVIYGSIQPKFHQKILAKFLFFAQGRNLQMVERTM